MDGLKICRAKRGLTQAELADALHVRQSTVGSEMCIRDRWETNGSYPRADMLPEIAAALSCTIDDLYKAPA